MDFSDERNFKILVVDDNWKNIEVLKFILIKAKYEIGFAKDGEEALGMLRENYDYDLVLLDIEMPVMDGYAACKAMREDEKLKDIPVIFLTAYVDIENMVKGFDAGAQDYVTKPFNARELLARVNTQLQLKHKTEQIKMINQVLEIKVDERTKELVDANTKLEKISKAKSDILALIAHELRTPLCEIIGTAEVLKSTLVKPKQKEFAQNLIESAYRLNKFAEVALLVTSLKLKEYDFSFKTENLNFIIENIIILHNEWLTKPKIVIQNDVNTDHIKISIDKKLMAYSIKCILENSVKFTPNNSEIEIKIAIVDEQYVKLSFCDNGPGFSEEALSQIFELFTATDIWHHTEGLGLSLATVKLIVDIHNGCIEANNNGNGAVVSMYLPIAK